MAVYFVLLSLVASSADASRTRRERQTVQSGGSGAAADQEGLADGVSGNTVGRALPTLAEREMQLGSARWHADMSLAGAKGAGAVQASSARSSVATGNSPRGQRGLHTRTARAAPAAACLAGSVTLAAACCVAGDRLACAMQQPALRMASMAAVATLVGSLLLPSLPRSMQPAQAGSPGACTRPEPDLRMLCHTVLAVHCKRCRLLSIHAAERCAQARRRWPPF